MCVIPVRVFRRPLLSPHFLHVLPISHDCLAPPHVPESRIERFIPQCIYSPHLSVNLCEFVIGILLFLFLLCLFLTLVSCPCSFCIRCSCVLSVSLVFVFSACVSSVGLLIFFLWLLPPDFILPLWVLVLVFFMLNVILTSWYWLWFVFSLTLILDLPCVWLSGILTPACILPPIPAKP